MSNIVLQEIQRARERLDARVVAERAEKERQIRECVELMAPLLDVYNAVANHTALPEQGTDASQSRSLQTRRQHTPGFEETCLHIEKSSGRAAFHVHTRWSDERYEATLFDYRGHTLTPDQARVYLINYLAEELILSPLEDNTMKDTKRAEELYVEERLDPRVQEHLQQMTREELMSFRITVGPNQTKSLERILYEYYEERVSAELSEEFHERLEDHHRSTQD